MPVANACLLLRSALLPPPHHHTRHAPLPEVFAASRCLRLVPDQVVDAYLWLKTPGESDGCTKELPSGGECPRFDASCGSLDSIGSIPGARAVPLVQNQSKANQSGFHPSPQPRPRPQPRHTCLRSICTSHYAPASLRTRLTTHPPHYAYLSACPPAPLPHPRRAARPRGGRVVRAAAVAARGDGGDGVGRAG